MNLRKFIDLNVKVLFITEEQAELDSDFKIQTTDTALDIQFYCYECSCGYRSMNSFDMIIHIQSKHKEELDSSQYSYTFFQGSFECLSCGNEIFLELENENQISESIEKVKCDKCGLEQEIMSKTIIKPTKPTNPQISSKIQPSNVQSGIDKQKSILKTECDINVIEDFEIVKKVIPGLHLAVYKKLIKNENQKLELKIIMEINKLFVKIKEELGING